MKLTYAQRVLNIIRNGFSYNGKGLCDACGEKTRELTYNKNDGLCNPCVPARDKADKILANKSS